MKKLKRELLIIKIFLSLGVLSIGVCVHRYPIGVVIGVILCIIGAALMIKGYKCPFCGEPLSPKNRKEPNCPRCKRPFGE